MEQKHVLISALGLGLGVGVGLGLASGQTVSKWTGGSPAPPSAMTPERVAEELRRMVVDGRESKITLDEFPYYLSDHAHKFRMPCHDSLLVGAIGVLLAVKN